MDRRVAGDDAHEPRQRTLAAARVSTLVGTGARPGWFHDGILAPPLRPAPHPEGWRGSLREAPLVTRPPRLLVLVRLCRVDGRREIGPGDAAGLLALGPVQLLVDLGLRVAPREQGGLGGQDHVRI